LVTGAKRSNHISPVLRQLHWLPVQQRVVFKIATLVYRSLRYINSLDNNNNYNNNAPGYLANDCQLVTDARTRLLHSADTRTLTVHRTSSCFGDRNFAAATTRVWNSFRYTYERQSCHTPGSGGHRKHFLFRQSDHGAL